MANSATLADLLDRVAAVCDEPTFSADTFVSKSQATQWINDALAKIHYMLADKPDDFFRDEFSIALVAGTSKYALPTDFLRANGVDELRGQKRFRVPRFMSQERNKWQHQAGETIGFGGVSTYEYRVAGSSLFVIPEPGVGELVLFYTPQFTKLEQDADVVDQSVPEGFEEYAVLDAALKFKIKERVDTAETERLRDVVWEQIKDFSGPRDADEPMRVVDVYNRFGRHGVRPKRFR